MSKRIHLINRRLLRDFILAEAKRLRPGWNCTMISSDTCERLELFLRRYLRREIERHPTLGKTFKLPHLPL